MKSLPSIRVVYDPSLRRPATPVTVFNSELKELADVMLATMHKNIGMGLAANQLGIDQDLLVIEYRPTKKDRDNGVKPIAPLALCNAQVIKTSQNKEVMTEGCLSVPKLELPVERASGVTVTAQDLTGKPVTIKAKGLLARILQHEIDHLDGILFTDRATGVKELKNYADIKIVFFGSDQFSAGVFAELEAAGLNIIAVVTETDKPAGRGGQLSAPLMKKNATEANIAVFQPETKDEITDILTQIQPDLVVLASYGKILPDSTLQVPTYGALNIHPSLLPKYRGATPLQSALLAGETATGVTVMKMNAGVDTGEIVSQLVAPIDDTETFTSLREKLAKIGGAQLIAQLPLYLAGQTKLIAQDSSLATGTTKLTKEMGEINWNGSPAEIDRQIRALNPWPGTYTFLGSKRLKILAAVINNNKLQFQTVQLEGKKPTAWPDFVQGYSRELKNAPWFDKIG